MLKQESKLDRLLRMYMDWSPITNVDGRHVTYFVFSLFPSVCRVVKKREVVRKHHRCVVSVRISDQVRRITP